MVSAIGVMQIFWSLPLMCSGVRLDAARVAQSGKSHVGKTVRVRMLWVRHGLSCANVMDACTRDPDEAKRVGEQYFSDLQASMDAQAQRQGKTVGTLDADFGVKPGTAWNDGDCIVRLIDPSRNLTAGEVGPSGDMVRVHDLYQDPLLTDCATRSSEHAGTALLTNLRRKGVRLDAVYSSALLRAMETAYAMVTNPIHPEDDRQAVLSKRALEHGVVPVPFMCEGTGHHTMELDNIPFPPETQRQMLQERYNESNIADTTRFEAWNHEPFNWAKFKAFLASVLLPEILDGAVPSKQQMGALQAALEQPWESNLEYAGRKYQEGAEFARDEFEAMASEEVTFLLAGHSAVMQATCNMPSKPTNNQVLQKLFVLERSADGKSTTLREQSGQCETLMDAPQSQANARSLLAREDVESCVKPFAVPPFVGFQPTQSTPTKCEQLTLADNAYPFHDDVLRDAIASTA